MIPSMIFGGVTQPVERSPPYEGHAVENRNDLFGLPAMAGEE
jgi:hypothetical protein